MTTLIDPNGSLHYIHDGERQRISRLLQSGYRRVGEPTIQDTKPEPTASTVTIVPDTVSIAQLKDWLATGPALSDVQQVFIKEQSGRHRKGALDALQDYLSDG